MGDLDLAINISSRSNLAAMAQARQAVQGLADQTNAVVPAIQAENVAEGERAVRQNVSSREIKILTRELLVSMGASHGAGAAGRFAAVGFRALGDSAEFANLALVTSGLAIVFLLPKLLSWAGAADQATQANESLRESVARELDRADEYLKYVADADEAHRKLAEDIRAVALAQQIIERQKLVDEIKAQGKEIEKTQSFWHDAVGFMMQVAPLLGDYTKRQEHDNEVREAATALIQEHLDRIRILDDAIAKGVVVEEKEHKAIEAGRQALEAKKKILEDLQRTYQEYDRAVARQQEATAKADVKREIEVTNFIIRTREQLRKKREKLNREQSEEDLKLAAEEQERELQKRINAGETAASALGALSELFGRNKALSIAAAIADTYAAANKAIAIYGPTPMGWAQMAIAIVKGLANVQQIRKAGFDDPINDAIAESFGRKFAQDMVRRVSFGFNTGLSAAAANAAPTGPTTTTIDRGLHIHGGMHLGGFFGPSETEFFKQFTRRLDAFQRRVGVHTSL